MIENSGINFITPALVTGAISVLSAIAGAIAGVWFATRKGSIEKRAKFETKEKMKMESTKEMIKAIRDFHLVIYQARREVFHSLQSMRHNLTNVADKNVEEFMAWRVDYEQGVIDRNAEYNKIEDIVFLLETDLYINDRDEEVQGEINRIKDILINIKNFLWR